VFSPTTISYSIVYVRMMMMMMMMIMIVYVRRRMMMMMIIITLLSTYPQASEVALTERRWFIYLAPQNKEIGIKRAGD